MDEEFDWLTLDADEEVVWSETPHPYSLVPAVVVGVPLSVVLVGVGILVGAYLSHRNTNYVVTTDALYKKTGVLSRNVQRIEFEKVQDTSYRQRFFGAHFGYGTVDVSTAGGGGVELSFRNVADPLSVQTLINERLRATRGRADEEGDADEVLCEILSELRAIRAAVEDGSADGSAGAAAADETGPSSAGAPATADDLTGRLGDGELAADGSTDRRSAASDAEELAPDPGDGGRPSAGDGEATGSDAEAFRYQDGQ